MEVWKKRFLFKQLGRKFQSLLSIRNQLKETQKPKRFPVASTKMATFLQGGPRIQLQMEL